jgi:hypothetical protein
MQCPICNFRVGLESDLFKLIHRFFGWSFGASPHLGPLYQHYSISGLLSIRIRHKREAENHFLLRKLPHLVNSLIY